MNPFKFISATDSNAAIAAHHQNSQAAFLAGGTNLMDLMKEHVALPEAVIDLGRIGLKEIKETAKGVSLGALASNTFTANHSLVRKYFPLLSKAILAGASAQIRNMATNGGNLLQRTRCSYFYDISMPCNKRNPGSGCAAMEGFNRMHAIFGWSDHCVAVYPSDMAIALSAMDARIKVSIDGSQREIEMKDFHLLPRSHPEKDNSLSSGELITSIELPKNSFGKHWAYVKVRDRNSYAFALVSVAVGLQMNNNTIESAKIAMGGVAHKPWRAFKAEAFLKGKSATTANFIKAAAMEMAGAKPLSHNQFKIEMSKKTLVSAMEVALKG